MRPRLDIRLTSLSPAERRDLEAALERIRLAPVEIWVISVMESAYGDWLLLLTGGGERPGPDDEWTFVAVEEGEGGERVCTYSRRVPPDEQSPAAVARSVERLLHAARPARAAGEPA
jgi:hypothetical protein